MTDPLIELAREFHAKNDPDKDYQYLDGSRDEYPSVLATVEALRTQQAMIVEWLRKTGDDAVITACHRVSADAIQQGAYLKGRKP